MVAILDAVRENLTLQLVISKGIPFFFVCSSKMDLLLARMQYWKDVFLIKLLFMTSDYAKSFPS